MHGASPQYIDLYSDKSDQVFSAPQRVGWVHLPTIASVVLGNFPIRLGEDFLSFPRPAPQAAPRNKIGLAPLHAVERANGASSDGIIRLPSVTDLDIQKERNATHFLCVYYGSLQHAIRYCNE